MMMDVPQIPEGNFSAIQYDWSIFYPVITFGGIIILRRSSYIHVQLTHVEEANYNYGLRRAGWLWSGVDPKCIQQGLDGLGLWIFKEPFTQPGIWIINIEAVTGNEASIH